MGDRDLPHNNIFRNHDVGHRIDPTGCPQYPYLVFVGMVVLAKLPTMHLADTTNVAIADWTVTGDVYCFSVASHRVLAVPTRAQKRRVGADRRRDPCTPWGWGGEAGRQSRLLQGEKQCNKRGAK